MKALSPLFIELVKILAGDEYDEEAEKQALLDFNRGVSDLRAKRDLRGEGNG
jgi:hypothetical protein